jgi:hypothetical protein
MIKHQINTKELKEKFPNMQWRGARDSLTLYGEEFEGLDTITFPKKIYMAKSIGLDKEGDHIFDVQEYDVVV